jgi:type I restriction enzyme S subunit
MMAKPWTDGVLGDAIVRVLGGGTPSRSNPAYWGGPIPWASVKDFRDGELCLTDTEESITAAGLTGSASNLIPAGTPIICTRMAVGRVASSGVDVAINQDLKALFLNNDRLQHRFALRLLEHLKPRLEALAVGSTVKGIDIGTMLGFPVRFPGLPEQVHIAEVLDTIDRMIRATELVIEKRQCVARGLVQKLFNRWEVGNGHPREGHITTVGDLCEKITDGTHQAVKTTEEGVPFLFVSCVRDGRIHWDHAARITHKTYETISPGRVPTPEAVLYTAVGSYGHAAVTDSSRPFGFQRHIAILYPNLGRLVPSYLAEWFNSEAGRRVSDRVAIGNAQKTVTLGALGTFPIPIPGDPSTQESLVGPIRAAREGIQGLEMELLKLRALKSGLSSDLLTGRVRIPTGASE